MKVREVVLDFTSLLDIIMIILFFFILFSNLDVESAVEQSEEIQSQYSSLIEETEQEQSQWREQAAAEWERIQKTDKNAARNQQALIDLDKGAMISMNLQEIRSGEDFVLSVTSNNKKVSDIRYESADKMTERLTAVLQECGLRQENVMIGVLTYDGYAYGTEIAVPMIEEAVRKIQKEYTSFYFTTINISK